MTPLDNKNSLRRVRRAGLAAACALALLIAACGGGSGSAEVADKPATREEAARFLTQATFGPTEADITHLMEVGYSAWIEEQVAAPQTSHRSSWDTADAAYKAADPDTRAGQREVMDSFYRTAVTGSDQLRQRVAYALSQVFVISMLDGTIGENPQGAAGYLDMLGANAFGPYRTLIEGVSRHPMMGIYLSSLRNQKENPATGRVPDENYAREVMQLFSIGLHRLNADGTPQMGSDGQPLATYTHDDIAGLAKVFTGWSWAGPDTADGRFYGNSNMQAADRLYQPMQGYAKFHSVSAKSFLGTTVGAQSSADPTASLNAAMNALAGHANVGPFIGRQLIQRLVTSNPSPAYVSRVAGAFSASNGDMKAMVRAVLLDPEARDAAAAKADPQYGKLREPVLRLTATLRALGAASDSGKWMVGLTDDGGSQLGQSPLRSSSVFNFYRPGFVAPGTESGAAGLTTPELQITHETTVAGYANYMRNGIQSGFGGRDTGRTRNDVQIPLTTEMALADRPAELVDSVANRLLGGSANADLKAAMVEAVQSVTIPALTATNQNQVDEAKRNRARIAVFLAVVSPEFLVQK